MNPLTTKLLALAKKSPMGGVFLEYQLVKYKSPKCVTGRDDSADLRMLENYSKCPIGTAKCVNTIKSGELYDLQIVVPVYKVEKYLRECIDSIISQRTKYNIIVFLVDDGSPDNCPKICDEYAEEDKRVRVIHKPNGGLSSARNEGIKEIIAKYLMFVDSDDRLTDGSIDKLMDIACSQNADIVQGSYHGLRNGVPTTKVGYSITSSIDYSRLQGFAWGKVFKNELFSNICFPEGYWFEDTVDSFLIYPKSNCTWGLSDLVYEYRVNNAGIMSKTQNNPKSLDSFWITRLLIKERSETEGYQNNMKYFQKLKSQIITNHLRLSSAPEDIKEAVFNLSANSVVEVFPNTDSLGTLTKSDLLFDKIIRDRNYKLFSKIAKWL